MNNCEAELKSSLGEKMLVTLVFAFVGCFTGIGFVLAAIVPEVVGAAPDIAQATWQVKFGVFVAGLLLFLIFLYGWYLHLPCHLCANDKGLSIYNGFRRSYIAWDKIASYRCRIRNCHHEIIFLDNAGQVIFRSPLHDFSMTNHSLKQKHRFWQYVQEKLIDADDLEWH